MSEQRVIEVSGWIETARYRIPLPTGWALHAAGSAERDFDLLGPADSLIFVRTPRRMPSLESFQGLGQQFRDIGQLERAAWIEFEYTRDARAWIDRHELLHRGMTPFVITLQAPADSAAACITALASVAEHIQAI